MNVLMVASSYPKFPGDVTAPFIESIAHAVAARGHAVDVLVPHHPDLRRPPGEPVRVISVCFAMVLSSRSGMAMCSMEKPPSRWKRRLPWRPVLIS